MSLFHRTAQDLVANATPVLTDLRLPILTDTPQAYWGRQPQTDIMVDFIKRHLETLKLFELSNMGSNREDAYALRKRLETWFVGGLRYFRKKS
jgi:hypothetical protein